MKKLFPFLLFFLVSTIYLQAQLTIVSSNPANNSANISSTTKTVSITFSAALDTAADFHENTVQLITNLGRDFIPVYSTDLTTVTFNVNLSANTDYYMLLFGVKAEDGSKLESPVVIVFTTSANFSGYNVSGIVSTDNPVFSPENSIVILSSTPLGNGEPAITNISTVNADGSYTIPNVKNGTYYPIAVKDENNDGDIEPGIGGDIIGFADSITVADSDVNGVNITLMTSKLTTFTDALAQADSIRNASLPAGAVLYYVQSNYVDSVGASDRWEFDYLTNNPLTGYEVDISMFGNSWTQITDSGRVYWLDSMKPIGDLVNSAAQPDSFIIDALLQGAAEFLNYQVGDTLVLKQQLMLGNLSHAGFGDIVPDQNAIYWGYQILALPVNRSHDWSNAVASIRFLADYQTGKILKVTDVKENKKATLPTQFKLEQNYPNPFNPTTTINFIIPEVGTKLPFSVQLNVYNILGEKVAVLVNKELKSGNYSVNFDAGNFPSGLYIYRLSAGKYIAVKKMMLLK